MEIALSVLMQSFAIFADPNEFLLTGLRFQSEHDYTAILISKGPLRSVTFRTHVLQRYCSISRTIVDHAMKYLRHAQGLTLVYGEIFTLLYSIAITLPPKE